jgi:hypothetical protein
MNSANRYRVTVSLINESADQDPYFTMEAHTVTLRPDGGLQIRGEKLGKSFLFGSWDAVEIRTIPIKAGVDYA